MINLVLTLFFFVALNRFACDKVNSVYLIQKGVMKAALIMTLFALSVLSGCTNTYQMQAKDFRINAFEMAEQGKYDLAIDAAKKGLKRAQPLHKINHELIEFYDGLGLYHYQKKDYRNAVYYQSITTVLSYYSALEQQANITYLQRLGWAYSKYTPGFNFVKISKSPLVLVCEKQSSALFYPCVLSESCSRYDREESKLY